MTEKKHQQIIRGTIDRISGNETVRIITKVTKVHPLYRKRYTQVKHYLAHNPANTAKVGDAVTIVGCKPISKLKQWVIQSN